MIFVNLGDKVVTKPVFLSDQRLLVGQQVETTVELPATVGDSSIGVAHDFVFGDMGGMIILPGVVGSVRAKSTIVTVIPVSTDSYAVSGKAVEEIKALFPDGVVDDDIIIDDFSYIE